MQQCRALFSCFFSFSFLSSWLFSCRFLSAHPSFLSSPLPIPSQALKAELVSANLLLEGNKGAAKASPAKPVPAAADTPAPEPAAAPALLLDDLFRKTEAQPPIYWLPPDESQVRASVVTCSRSPIGQGAEAGCGRDRPLNSSSPPPPYPFSPFSPSLPPCHGDRLSPTAKCACGRRTCGASGQCSARRRPAFAGARARPCPSGGATAARPIAARLRPEGTAAPHGLPHGRLHPRGARGHPHRCAIGRRRRWCRRPQARSPSTPCRALMATAVNEGR